MDSSDHFRAAIDILIAFRLPERKNGVNFGMASEHLERRKPSMEKSHPV